MTDREIRKKAKSFMKEYSLNKVDYDSLCDITEKLGYVVAEFDPCLEDSVEYELAKMLKFSDKLQNTRGMTYAAGEYRLVFVDDRLSISEKLIVLAHEIGHIVLGHMDRNYVIGRDVVEEYEANVFASFLVDKKQSSEAGRLWLVGGIAAVSAILASVILITYHTKTREAAEPNGYDNNILGIAEESTTKVEETTDLPVEETVETDEANASEETESITQPEDTTVSSESEKEPEYTTGETENEELPEDTTLHIDDEIYETSRPVSTLDVFATIESRTTETTAKETTAKETTAKETTAKETTAKETTAKETTAKETTAKETTVIETTVTPETTHTHVVESTTSISADNRKWIFESYCKECGEKTYRRTGYIYLDLDDAYTLDKLATIGLYGDMSAYNQFYADWLIRERNIPGYSGPDWSRVKIIPISDAEMTDYRAEAINGICQKLPGHGSTTPEIVLDEELCSTAQAELEKYAFENKFYNDISKIFLIDGQKSPFTLFDRCFMYGKMFDETGMIDKGFKVDINERPVVKLGVGIIRSSCYYKGEGPFESYIGILITDVYP